MKKLFLLFLVAGLLAACGDEENTSSENSNVQESVAAEEPQEELTRSDEIEERVNEIIVADLKDTTVNKLSVNENMGLDDGSYIVLPHLIWDVKNKPKMTREMLEMYSNHLAAKLGEESDISEITIFWEVPYHLEGENSAKFNYQKSGDGMAVGERWYAPVLQE